MRVCKFKSSQASIIFELTVRSRCRTKLNNARSFKDILQQILQYQDLLMIMYGIEQENCVCTRKHFGHFLEISDTLKKHKQHLVL